MAMAWDMNGCFRSKCCPVEGYSILFCFPSICSKSLLGDAHLSIIHRGFRAVLHLSSAFSLFFPVLSPYRHLFLAVLINLAFPLFCKTRQRLAGWGGLARLEGSG